MIVVIGQTLQLLLLVVLRSMYLPASTILLFIVLGLIINYSMFMEVHNWDWIDRNNTWNILFWEGT